MSAKAERPKNRRVKLVGGGYRYTRQSQGTGGSLKSQRRKLRQQAKGLRKGPKREDTVAQRKVIKERLAELLAQKDGR